MRRLLFLFASTILLAINHHVIAQDNVGHPAVLSYPAVDEGVDWSKLKSDAVRCETEIDLSRQYRDIIVLLRSAQAAQAQSCFSVFQNNSETSSNQNIAAQNDLLEAFFGLYKPESGQTDVERLQAGVKALETSIARQYRLDWTSGTLVDLIYAVASGPLLSEQTGQALLLANTLTDRRQDVEILSWRSSLAIRHVLLKLSEAKFEASADLFSAFEIMNSDLKSWADRCETSQTCELVEKLYFRSETLRAIVSAEVEMLDVDVSELPNMTIEKYTPSFQSDCLYTLKSSKRKFRWPVAAKTSAMASGILIRAHAVPGKKLEFLELVDAIPSSLMDDEFSKLFKDLTKRYKMTLSEDAAASCQEGGELFLTLSMSTDYN